MKQLALALVLLALSSCATSRHPTPHSATAPPRWARQYRHHQRQNERQRRRWVTPNITWN